QAPRAGELGIAGVAAAQRPARLEQLGPGRPVDRAVDPAAAEQARVRGVDDRVGVGVRGDVAEVKGDRGHAEGAADRVRTGDLNLGRVALYQLSYCRTRAEGYRSSRDPRRRHYPRARAPPLLLARHGR